MQEHIIDVVIVFLLVVVNGILAMAEIALVSSNRIKITSLAKKSQGARVAAELMDNPGSFLSTIQIGITVIGIVSGAFSGQRFAEPLGMWLNQIPWIHGHGSTIAFSFVVILITYVSLIIGELIPKRIALSRAEKVASLLSRPVRLLSNITYPFVFILDVSAKAVLRLFNQTEIKESIITEEEIHSVIRQGLEGGAIDNFEHGALQKIFQFGDCEASVIMTPRIKITYLDLEDSIEESMRKILRNPHHYYPVFEGGLDNLKGIIDIKDILMPQIEGKSLDLKSLVRIAPCIDENTKGPKIIEQFQQFKTHIAVVVDEYGAMQGIITLVDLFETLVGVIPESLQEKHYEIVTREDGSWLCDGLTPIDEVERLLGADIVNTLEESDFNTLAGFLLAYFKHIPKAGEYMSWNGFKFEIMDMDGARIDKILIQRNEAKHLL